MKKFISILSLLCLHSFSFTQNYTSYFNGDTSDVTTAAVTGTCLMGGATENDSAMTWFLKRSAGGDIVVLRVTGTNGYNNYIYSGLPVSVNSVETLVIPSLTAANDPYVEQQIRNAEALFIAGGDQSDYVSYWKNTPVEDAINYLINTKNVPVGGTSAGMAIMGQFYFDAANGTVTSSTALSDPMNAAVSIGYGDFISNPVLTKVITDTHYDNPDRRGRHFVFLARMLNSLATLPRGIASEEYTAVCIDEAGNARVFGDYPAYDDFAYFIQPNCFLPNTPETMTASTPLTWDRNQAAVLSCKVPGTPTGQYTFDLNSWAYTTGGSWENWYVQNGVFNVSPASSSPCLSSINDISEVGVLVYPNPAESFINLNSEEEFSLYDSRGAFLGTFNGPSVDVSKLSPGVYLLQYEKFNIRFVKK